MTNSLLKDILDPTDSALLADLARGSPMTFVVVDQNHIIVAIEGGQLMEALGYAWPTELVGKPVEIFLPPDKRESHKGWFDSWIERPAERALRDAQPMTVQKKEEGTIQVRISIKKLFLNDGSRLGASYAGKPFIGGVAYCFTI